MMSSSIEKIIYLRPDQNYFATAVGGLISLRTLLTAAKTEYLAASAELASCSIRLGREDPGLHSHAFLSQIERLEVGITVLAEAAQTLRGRT